MVNHGRWLDIMGTRMYTDREIIIMVIMTMYIQDIGRENVYRHSHLRHPATE